MHSYPKHLVTTLRLADGTAVTLRPIRTADAAIEQQFVRNLSDESRYFRFMDMQRELSPQMLKQMTEIDYYDQMALIAVTRSSGKEIQIAVGRYVVFPNGEDCEFAIVVSDAWQRKGIARALMQLLIEAARSRGLEKMIGDSPRQQPQDAALCQHARLAGGNRCRRPAPDARDQGPLAQWRASQNYRDTSPPISLCVTGRTAFCINRRGIRRRSHRQVTIAAIMNQQLNSIVRQVGKIILGKEHQIRLAIACLLARGHLLIEDIPGVGKTTLAHALAATLGLQFQRIQFTSDLLPADILGVSIFDREASNFRFHPGPIFAQVILADEVNRATPKTQSALLEAMEEHQVTAEGETRPLPEPFFVIATQNPSHQIGTFPLPESQLDRFLMRIELGYPDASAERALLQGVDRRDLLPQLAPCIQPEELAALQRAARAVHAAGALLDYLQALVDYSRKSPDYVNGLSPRAALALLNAARAWAMMHGRHQVLPEDVQAIVPAVVGHRLFIARDNTRISGAAVAEQLIEAVPIP